MMPSGAVHPIIPGSRLAARPGSRCAAVDLNRWFSGVYAVPGKEEEDEDGAPKSEPGERSPD